MEIELIGKKITNIRWMTLSEKDEFGWWRNGVVVELEDGLSLIASSDDEGNDQGTFYLRAPDGNEYGIWPNGTPAP